MSTTPIHHGSWTDWTSGRDLVWTTGSSAASKWTNFIAFMLGAIVITACWNVVAFSLHYFGDRINPKGKDDGLHRHHRLIWRNVGDAFGAALEVLAVGWRWWRTEILPQDIRRTRMSRGWIFGRTLLAVTAPVILFGCFTAASILVAGIALSGGNVLIKAHSVGECGLLQYPNGSFIDPSTSADTLRSFQSKGLRDTIQGRAYARSCYSRDFPATGSCSFYVKPSIMYFSQQFDNSGCPFGDQDIAFESGPCNASNNAGAYQMYSGIIDSDRDLGINAAPEHRVTFQKNTTCSVINPDPYQSSTKGLDTSPYNYTYSIFCLGPVGQDGKPTDCNYDTSTFRYNPAEKEFDVGYQTNSRVYKSKSDKNEWQPLPEFRRQDGDTTLVSMSANSVQYTQQVYDPFFLATSPTTSEPGVGLGTLYSGYHQVNIIGCVDQYTMCNPQFSSKCTTPSGITDLRENYKMLELNDHQKATAFRILVMLLNTDTYSNTYSTGGTALKADDKAFAQVSAGLPNDQWIKEVEGWLEIGLAKLQSYAVQYATNPDRSVVGEVKIPAVEKQLQEILVQQCGTQKIKSSGDLRNLSLDGITVVAVIGGLMTLLGLPFHPAILPMCRRGALKISPHRFQAIIAGKTKHQIDYIVDGLFHLYLMAVEDRDNPHEYNMHDDIPTFPENPTLPSPGERTRPTWPSGQVRGKAIVYHYIDTPQMVNNPNNGAPLVDPGQQGPNQGQSIPLSTLAPPATSPSQQALLPPANSQQDSTLAASSHDSPGSSMTIPDATAPGVTPNSALANAAPTATTSGMGNSTSAASSNAHHVEQDDND